MFFFNYRLPQSQHDQIYVNDHDTKWTENLRTGGKPKFKVLGLRLVLLLDCFWSSIPRILPVISLFLLRYDGAEACRRSCQLWAVKNKWWKENLKGRRGILKTVCKEFSNVQRIFFYRGDFPLIHIHRTAIPFQKIQFSKSKMGKNKMTLDKKLEHICKCVFNLKFMNKSKITCHWKPQGLGERRALTGVAIICKTQEMGPKDCAILRFEILDFVFRFPTFCAIFTSNDG